MKYAVLIPYYGRRDADHLACVEKLKKAGIEIVTCDGCPYVDMARAMLVQMALDHTSADVFLFIDHDIMFKKEHADSIALNCHVGEYDVLGALYAYRRAVGGIIGRLKDPPATLEFYKPGFWPAEFLGMGFTAIKREVFEALAKTLPKAYCSAVFMDVHPFFMHSIHPDGYHGEDISFCRRAEEVGFKLGVDLEPRLIHRGSYDFMMEDAGASAPRYEALTINFKRVDEPRPKMPLIAAE